MDYTVCMFYHAPVGCKRGDMCQFLHLKRDHRRIKYNIKSVNLNGVCVPSLTKNCIHGKCDLVHPEDDIRNMKKSTLLERYKLLEQDYSELMQKYKIKKELLLREQLTSDVERKKRKKIENYHSSEMNYKFEINEFKNDIIQLQRKLRISTNKNSKNVKKIKVIQNTIIQLRKRKKSITIVRQSDISAINNLLDTCKENIKKTKQTNAVILEPGEVSHFGTENVEALEPGEIREPDYIPLPAVKIL